MATKFKIVKKGTEARNELIKGADFLADAVRSTLGPFGVNFYLEKGSRTTNDGVSIAKEIEVRDEIQQRGVVALREAAIKTNDRAGDGTTTSIVLAQAIVKEAIRFLGDDMKGIAGKLTPSEIIKKIETERLEVVDKLLAMTKPITTREQLIASAKVSVEDDELGVLIGGTQWDLGKDGIMIAEETAERTSSVERVTGIRIDNGLGTSLVINNQEKQSLEVTKVKVIMTNYVIRNLKPLEKIIDQLVKTGVRDIAIIARAFTPEVIQVCMQNIKNGVGLYPINAPYTDQNEIMKDLASVLGGTYCFDEQMMLEDLQLSDIGYAEKIIAKRYDAVITGKQSEDNQKLIDKRIEELNKKLEGEKSDFEKRNLKSRISQLTNGFAIVKIGATSDTERKYRKDKADDAVNAVRVALQEGVVPGAGIAFKEISESLPSSYILKRPLLSIYEQIMFSAPKDFKIEDWVKDPTFVLNIALENACSIASMLSTVTGATATERDKPCLCGRINSNEDEEETNQ